MKICPACHQETFDGRSSCHRCGTDVSQVLPLALPSRDPATLVSRWPFLSRRGELQLDLTGVTFNAEIGGDAVTIPAERIISVDSRGAADLVVTYGDEGQEQRRRFRVQWAPIADRVRAAEARGMAVTAGRTVAMGLRSPRRRKSARDLTVVRDRWLSALETLLAADRYAVRRRSY